MTRERIDDMREVVLPFVKKRLLETNYEGLGEADAKEFEREFNEILNLAIKALEQEPTTKNNLAVDKLISDCEKMSFDIEIFNKPLKVVALDAVKNIVKDLSPVTPQSRWIPVSERLPNDRDWYLGIFKEPDTGWINPLPFICDYVGRETKATTKEYWILRGFTDIDRSCDYYFNLECVAWMPLPQPYGEVEE